MKVDSIFGPNRDKYQIGNIVTLGEKKSLKLDCGKNISNSLVYRYLIDYFNILKVPKKLRHKSPKETTFMTKEISHKIF